MVTTPGIVSHAVFEWYNRADARPTRTRNAIRTHQATTGFVSSTISKARNTGEKRNFHPALADPGKPGTHNTAGMYAASRFKPRNAQKVAHLLLMDSRRTCC